MPSHARLIDRFGVSGVTIQQALNQLASDGFIYSLPRKGTFVVPDPPHLSHYAITFHTQPSDPVWQQFWAALSREAIALQQSGAGQLSLFYGIHGWQRGRDYEQLIELTSRHQVAGLIFTSDPHSLVGSPLLTVPDIPRVAVADRLYRGMTSVRLGSPAQVIAAELKKNGRRRVAILSTPDYEIESLRDAILESVEGVELRPEWQLAVRIQDAQWARNAALALMAADRGGRPDVLIITDDNLVPFATAGIAASGVRVPEELLVLAHCNFPWATLSSVEARRFGYDVRTVLRACVDVIDAARAGNGVPERIDIPAVEEDEISATRAEPQLVISATKED